MQIDKPDIAKREIETAIDLFLSDSDFISAMTLAGAPEDILGALLRRKGGKPMLEQLHSWYEETTKTKIAFSEFARGMNLGRNTLKHATNAEEDKIEIFRWEAVLSEWSFTRELDGATGFTELVVNRGGSLCRLTTRSTRPAGTSLLARERRGRRDVNLVLLGPRGRTPVL